MRGFFLAEFAGGDDFFEGSDGDFAGDPTGWAFQEAVEVRELTIVFGSQHDQLWRIRWMRSNALLRA